jgi:arginase
MGVHSLRAAGIAEILRGTGSFVDLGDVCLSEIDADTGPKNLRNFPQFLKDTDSVELAASKVCGEHFVFCLGGGCELIVGTLAGFKSVFKGEPGAVWIDAHGDFNTPETSPSGFIGGMGLAMACGRGPRLSPTIERTRPLLVEENVVHIASRALDQAEYAAMSSSPMKLYPATTVHKEGIVKVAGETAAYLADRCDWIICHLDVDAMDREIIPAVNFPEPGGLSINEVATIVENLKRTGKLRVFNLTSYNPTFDKNHTSSQKLIKLVSELFS